MFDFACIYSPDLGDDEHVEKQLVFTTGPQSVDEFVKLIGVAQGIAELAHSFDHTSPAKWVKTGRGAAAKLVLIVPLANSSPDWRSGYWFAGQVALTATTWPAEAIYRHIRLAYERWCFVHGPAKESWPDLTATEPPDLCSVVAPDAIRLAPGTLSPTAKAGIEEIRKQAGAADVVITSAEDGSAIWPGQHLSIEARTNIQRWLTRAKQDAPAGPGASELKSSNSASSEAEGNQAGGGRADGHGTDVDPEVPRTEAPKTDAAPSEGGFAESSHSDLRNDELNVGKTDVEPAGESVGPAVETPTEESRQGSETGDADASSGPARRHSHDSTPSVSGVAPQKSEPSAQSNSWFSMPNMRSLSISGMPSISMPGISMPSMSMPSVSMPMPAVAMPDMAAVNSYLPSVPSALRGWWDSSAALATDDAGNDAGYVLSEFACYDAAEDCYLYITAYRRALFVYHLVFREPAHSVRSHKTVMPHFDALVAQLEGFSFAFAPPTRFCYMIIDRKQRTVTSTFPNTLATEVLGTLLSPPTQKPEVIRVGSTWLYFVTLKDGVEAIFGKKGVSSQQGSLLGALHSDVNQWLSDYERRLL